MLECPFTVDIWQASPLAFRLSHWNRRSLKEWALLIAQNLVPNSNPMVVMGRAVDWWQDFLRVACFPSQSVSHGVPPRWSCLPTGRLKLNVDGAWDKEQCLGGVGIIIKNAKGNFVGAAYHVFMEVFSPIQVEALVM
ncbi:hypothetical protein D8674_026782 [Pyrus ussuriensis x Pyrus communis]|uniref:RNase H type-1 domain-containing protein n=1 Tax=Pyrus ussuriensis x Pyrus communis TaxID=2448454 RepID=A0A5N5I8V3_9ROSA|nr:hypothetical protein D8674_026782 [Pyrus ussuriensis x Pyrus communis]